MLTAVKEQGTMLLVRMDEAWAAAGIEADDEDAKDAALAAVAAAAAEEAAAARGDRRTEIAGSGGGGAASSKGLWDGFGRYKKGRGPEEGSASASSRGVVTKCAERSKGQHECICGGDGTDELRR